jgi:hypothetical protein
MDKKSISKVIKAIEKLDKEINEKKEYCDCVFFAARMESKTNDKDKRACGDNIVHTDCKKCPLQYAGQIDNSGIATIFSIKSRLKRIENWPVKTYA